MAVIRSVDQAADLIRAAAGQRTAPGRAAARTLVGIAGAPGAGKSTLAQALVDRLGPDAVLLPMDGFHLPQRRLVELGRRDRMGAPDTFDVDAFLTLLRRVQTTGVDALAPGFDRTIEEPVPGAIRIGREHSIVVTEGNYLLLESGGWEAAAELLDVTFFLEVPREVRLRRLVDRHIRFGKSPQAAEAWVHGPDERNAEQISATAPRAGHLVVLT